jgi:hypothetical protein
MSKNTKSKSKKLSLWARFQRIRDGKMSPRTEALLYGCAFVLVVILGVSFQDINFGRVAILTYGVIALVFGIKSVETFKLALVAMVCVPVLIILSKHDLAQNFAEYAYLLLFFGVVASAIEMLRSKRITARK